MKHKVIFFLLLLAACGQPDESLHVNSQPVCPTPIATPSPQYSCIDGYSVIIVGKCSFNGWF